MNPMLVPIALVLLASTAPAQQPPPGVTFKAVSRSASEGFDLARLSNATVRGWAQGDRGRIDFLGEEGDIVGEGSLLLTEDGGASARLYDSVRRTCLPWEGNAGSLAAGEVSGLTVEKVTDEPGPLVAGLPTRHYRFDLAWQVAGKASEQAPTWRWKVVEEFWATPGLTDAALTLCLNTQTRSTGDPEADGRVAAAFDAVEGTPLRRVTVIAVETGERTMQSTVTLEVTELEHKAPPAGTFEVPDACRASSGVG